MEIQGFDETDLHVLQEEGYLLLLAGKGTYKASLKQKSYVDYETDSENRTSMKEKVLKRRRQYTSKQNEYTVLVFDICSSTVFIEDLVKTNQLETYCDLVESFRNLLLSIRISGMTIYKFLGDGFVLLFGSEILFDEVLLVSKKLAEFAKDTLGKFIRENIETTAIPRIGITIGIDIGNLNDLKLDGTDEFIGRPLNVSSRLQGSLKDKNHENKILMSVKAYKKISNLKIKRKCIERERIFRNLSDNNRTRCYELDALWT